MGRGLDLFEAFLDFLRRNLSGQTSLPTHPGWATQAEVLSGFSRFGAPDMVLEMPEDTIAPFILALGTGALFVGLLLKTWTVVIIGGVITALALLVWLWPRQELREREPAHG